MRVLNLYAGIGGNRKLWEGVTVTAVEYNAEIAAIYQEYFPSDTVIVADAHEYLLTHYKEFDFIWASPPCQTHSRLRHAQKNKTEPKFPDAKLWQEIIFLKHHATCPYVIENVIPYYSAFLEPTVVMDRHLFWSNFKIATIQLDSNERVFTNKVPMKIRQKKARYGFDLQSKIIKGLDKEQILNNLVNPEIGLAILDQVRGIKRKSKLKQISILDVADGA